jgi:hypothetical protein
MKLFFICSFVFASVVVGAFSAAALAQQTVQFTNRELAAGFVFLRPEMNSISLDGRTGTFTPSPALQYLGIQPETFQLDMSTLGDIADIEFNQLKTKSFDVSFSDHTLKVNVQMEDQAQAVRTRVGAISIQNLGITVSADFENFDAGQELTVASSEITGTMTGTGVLHANWILKAVKKLVLKTITNKIKAALETSTTQESLQKGLTSWAKFYDGKSVQEIIPGSIQFTDDGISYEVRE